MPKRLDKFDRLTMDNGKSVLRRSPASGWLRGETETTKDLLMDLRG